MKFINSMKNLTTMEAFYFFPFISYAKQKNSIEKGIYVGWFCWLIFFQFKNKEK